MRCRGGVACLAACSLVLGCAPADDKSAPTEARVAPVAAFVTDEVASRLRSDGQFESGELGHISSVPTITAARARELAEAYLAAYAIYNRSHWEGLRGGSIDFPSLRADDRVVLAEATTVDLPLQVATPIRKHLGSYYLVDFAHPGGAVVLNVAVSGLATDIQIGARGLRATAAYGNEFRVWVTPLGGRSEPASSPEAAAEATSRAFGRLVAAAPRFLRAGGDFAPHLGQWQLELASPVEVVTARNGRSVETREVFYHGATGFSIRADVTREVHLRLPDSTRTLRSVAVHARQGSPTKLIAIQNPLSRQE